MFFTDDGGDVVDSLRYDYDLRLVETENMHASFLNRKTRTNGIKKFLKRTSTGKCRLVAPSSKKITKTKTTDSILKLCRVRTKKISARILMKVTT